MRFWNVNVFEVLNIAKFEGYERIWPIDERASHIMNVFLEGGPVIWRHTITNIYKEIQWGTTGGKVITYSFYIPKVFNLDLGEVLVLDGRFEFLEIYNNQSIFDDVSIGILLWKWYQLYPPIFWFLRFWVYHSCFNLQHNLIWYNIRHVFAFSKSPCFVGFSF